ncbi:MAG: KpsF/GutQ family sugar-phosphate isomerase [Lachnospiraceae bacterium]|nr:KpsF/GutQ family sugar-phosphate isomerase [Lachnospiraceae bacterium]
MELLESAKRVFDLEIEALKKTRDALDGNYLKIIDAIVKCDGKVIITGIGKPGHIAAKMAATFSSLGTPSFRLHPAEAMHGDLGMITAKDVVIAISYSGESDEIINIISAIKMIGATLIAITGNSDSTLAKASDIVQVLPKFEEACSLGPAPTSSTTAALCYGDSLAVVASEVYGFRDSDFFKLHPAGSLGKKMILRVCDLMSKGKDVPYINENELLMDAITEMTNKGLGVVSVVNDIGELVGIITDGDLRRIIEKRTDIYSEKVNQVMTKYPKKVAKDLLAIEALQFIKTNNISNVPVVDENNKLIGTITWAQIIKAGIVI